MQKFAQCATTVHHMTKQSDPTWNRRLSVLSTRSSIFSPLSKTRSMLSTMMFLTSSTCTGIAFVVSNALFACSWKVLQTTTHSKGHTTLAGHELLDAQDARAASNICTLLWLQSKADGDATWQHTVQSTGCKQGYTLLAHNSAYLLLYSCNLG